MPSDLWPLPSTDPVFVMPYWPQQRVRRYSAESRGKVILVGLGKCHVPETFVWMQACSVIFGPASASQDLPLPHLFTEPFDFSSLVFFLSLYLHISLVINNSSNNNNSQYFPGACILDVSVYFPRNMVV